MVIALVIKVRESPSDSEGSCRSTSFVNLSDYVLTSALISESAIPSGLAKAAARDLSRL
jgi:hypothetical protein